MNRVLTEDEGTLVRIALNHYVGLCRENAASAERIGYEKAQAYWAKQADSLADINADMYGCESITLTDVYVASS